MRGKYRFAILLLSALVLLNAFSVVSAAFAADPDSYEMSLSGPNTQEAVLSQRAERRFVVDYDEGGPLVEVVQTGCDLTFTPTVNPDGTVHVSLELDCLRIADPVPQFKIPTPFGRQKVQRPSLETLTVNADVVAASGETIPVASSGALTVLVTPEVLPGSEPFQSVMVSVLIPGFAFDTQLPGSTAGLTAVVYDAQQVEVYDTTAQRFVTGFREGDPKTEDLKSGCDLKTRPIVRADRTAIMTEVDLECADVTGEGARMQVGSSMGQQKVRQPVLRKVHVKTTSGALDGDAVVLGGIRNGTEEIVLLSTAALLDFDVGNSPQVSVEALMDRRGDGIAVAPAGTGYTARLKTVGYSTQRSLLDDVTSRALITSTVDGNPVVESVESGCSLMVRPTVSSDRELVTVELFTECVAHTEQGRSHGVRTKRKSKLQELDMPVLHSLGISTVVRMRDGETIVVGRALRGEESALVLVTAHIVEIGSHYLQVLVEVTFLHEGGGESVAAFAEPAEPFLELLRAVALSGQRLAVHDRTQRHVLSGMPDKATEIVEEGCSLDVLPVISADGSVVNLEFSAECSALDRDMKKRRFKGKKTVFRIHLPVTHRRSLTTTTAARDGETVALGGAAKNGSEALFFMTPRIFGDSRSSEQVLVESRFVSTAEGAGTAGSTSGARSSLESLNMLLVSSTEAYFESLAEHFVHAGADSVDAVEEGCTQAATALVTPDSNTILDTSIRCRTLDLPVKRTRSRKIRGRWEHVELPVVREFEAETAAFIQDGATIVLAGASGAERETLAFATPVLTLSPEAAVIGPAPMVNLNTRVIRGVEGGSEPVPGAFPLCETVRLTASDNSVSELDTLALQETAVSRRRGSPVMIQAETGVLVSFLPQVLPDASIAADLALECLVLDESGTPPYLGSHRSYRKRPHRQVLSLESDFIAGSGDTVRLAGSWSSLDVEVLATMELLPLALNAPANTPQNVRLTLEFVPRE